MWRPCAERAREGISRILHGSQSGLSAFDNRRRAPQKTPRNNGIPIDLAAAIANHVKLPNAESKVGKDGSTAGRALFIQTA